MKLDLALEFLERNWCIIPIKPDGKRPAIKWREYQKRLPTVEEVTEWWTRWPTHNLALVTGDISGILVVDCDNETAQHAAYDAGMRSPIKVKTPHGSHLYFETPKDGERRGPRAGVNSKGSDWPRIDGLDFRGDGSYALLPGSDGYEWDYDTSVFDIQMDMPVWQDWKPSVIQTSDESPFDFSTMDLTSVDILHERISEWDVTAQYVLEHFPTTKKIPTGAGNGRNEKVMRYVSECILDGYFGPELRLRGIAYMKEFFVDHLPDREFDAIIESMENAERRNHPERFSDDGEYIYTKRKVLVESLEEKKPRRLIQMKDAEDLLAKSKAKTFLIEPWLPPASIVQVYGYSGHGKSMFVQHAMAALCTGRKYFGPFEINQVGRVLYLDFEMGMATVAKRLVEMRQIHGNTEDRLNIWTPFVNDEEINLNTREGLVRLEGWIHFATPDVVVIDTIRSGYPGMSENSAEEWSKINQLSVKLRNSGYAVILIHHSNKPGEHSIGREAGSTNQLTVLETQIRVAQVYRDEDTAKQNAAIWDGSYTTPVWPKLSDSLPATYRLEMVMEIRYGKVREWSDVHDRVQWVGFAADMVSEKRCVVSSKSTKQKAKDLALNGLDPETISDRLSRPLRTIQEWLEISK